MFTVGLGLLGATVIIMIFQNTALGDPHRLRLRRLAARAVPARRRRHLHQGGRRRRRPRRQGRSRHPRGRPPQPGHHRRQRGRQRRRLRRHGRRPVRELRGHARRLDHPRRRRVPTRSARQPGARASIFPLGRPCHRRARVDRRRVRGAGHRQGQVGAWRRSTAGFLTAGILTVVGTLVVALVYVGNDEARSATPAGTCSAPSSIGLVLAQVVSRLTEYFTSHRDHARCRRSPRRPAPARPPPCCPASRSGLESSVYAIIAIAIAIGVAHRARRRQPPVLALPRRPHRHGHARHHRRHRVRGHVRPGRRQRRRHRRDVGRVRGRARADHGEPRRRRQHHQGRHQGLRHRLGGHRRGRAVRLATSRRSATSSASLDEHHRQRRRVQRLPHSQINVADPKIFIGLLIGGSVPFLFSALAIRAVGRTAGVVVQEVRSQFADGKIMSGREAARLRPGHRHLHRGVAARARHAGAARRAHAGDHRLRHQLLRPRRVPRRASSSPAS